MYWFRIWTFVCRRSILRDVGRCWPSGDIRNHWWIFRVYSCCISPSLKQTQATIGPSKQNNPPHPVEPIRCSLLGSWQPYRHIKQGHKVLVCDRERLPRKLPGQRGENGDAPRCSSLRWRLQKSLGTPVRPGRVPGWYQTVEYREPFKALRVRWPKHNR